MAAYTLVVIIGVSTAAILADIYPNIEQRFKQQVVTTSYEPASSPPSSPTLTDLIPAPPAATTSPAIFPKPTCDGSVLLYYIEPHASTYAKTMLFKEVEGVLSDYRIMMASSNGSFDAETAPYICHHDDNILRLYLFSRDEQLLKKLESLDCVAKLGLVMDYREGLRLWDRKPAIEYK
jgi:hypothetical protein